MSTPAASLSLDQGFRQRLAKNANDLDARRKLARLCHVEGKTQEAAEHYALLAQRNDRDVEALTYLAQFYLERGSPDNAFALLQGVLRANPNHKGAFVQLIGMQVVQQSGRAATKLAPLFERLVDLEENGPFAGLAKSDFPCLIDMNGDLIWLPGDLLRFLWHTVQKPIRSAVPSFMAEATHYHWIRERLKEGDTILDVGSNLGIFATMMGARAGRSGRVFAFEPSPRIAADLRRVLALNELPNVTVIEAAVSDASGEATFCDVQEADVRRESSHLEALHSAHGRDDLKRNSAVVKTIRLDDFVETEKLRPSLIKIDVEGAEFLVLEGARRTIAASKPKLVIEFHPNHEGVFDHERLKAYLSQYGYQHATETKTYYCW